MLFVIFLAFPFTMVTKYRFDFTCKMKECPAPPPNIKLMSKYKAMLKIMNIKPLFLVQNILLQIFAYSSVHKLYTSYPVITSSASEGGQTFIADVLLYQGSWQPGKGFAPLPESSATLVDLSHRLPSSSIIDGHPVFNTYSVLVYSSLTRHCPLPLIIICLHILSINIID